MRAFAPPVRVELKGSCSQNSLEGNTCTHTKTCARHVAMRLRCWKARCLIQSRLQGM